MLKKDDVCNISRNRTSSIRGSVPPQKNVHCFARRTAFDRSIAGICALLGYYAASNGKLHWTSWPLKMGPIRCPETSVKGYHSTLRNTPEERRSHQHRGGRLKEGPFLIHSLPSTISDVGLEGMGVGISYLTVITHTEKPYTPTHVTKTHTSCLGMTILTTDSATELIHFLPP
jgi:hypothetical protein